MVINNKNAFAAAISLVLAMTGCGGGSGGDASAPPPPPPEVTPPPDPAPPQQAFKLELLTGQTSVDLQACGHANGPAATARFSRLLRATAYQDALYLAETGEGCPEVASGLPDLLPKWSPAAIRKLSAGTVATALPLNTYITIGSMPPPTTVRHPSGFVRSADGQGGTVLAYAAARSGASFVLDEPEVARYTQRGWWNYHVPGLFKLTDAIAGPRDLVAGTPGKSPARVDGTGHAAGFVAPHDLEADASGLLYLIDDGRIRTIDARHQVKTLDHAALGISGEVVALDSDHAGAIHVLAKRGDGAYAWHRLQDGVRRDFRLYDVGFGVPPLTQETFAVVGDAIVLGLRVTGSDDLSPTKLYRVPRTGAVEQLTGTALPGAGQEFLQRPSASMLPAVQHIEYGPDGHLYLVLPQGVLVARDYR